MHPDKCDNTSGQERHLTCNRQENKYKIQQCGT
jgi:hypothetical protein